MADTTAKAIRNAAKPTTNAAPDMGGSPDIERPECVSSQL